MLMKFLIVLGIISTIINIIAYYIQKRQVGGIKTNFNGLRDIYRHLKKDRED